ncbi:hypothetical protein Btru_007837, partial [Bulinus truncatus]
LAYKFTLTFETDTDTVVRRFPCRRQMFTSVNSRSVDVRCENSEFINRIILEGEGITSLCSVYVSSGRNVALNQPTEQTSTNGTYYAGAAVDGDTSTTSPYGSCTLTNATEVSQTWTLTFNGPVIVNNFEIYSRVDSPMKEYFTNSRLITLDKNNTTVINNTMPYTTYTTTNINSTPIQKIKIIATNYSYPTAILSLCEVLAYGDGVYDNNVTFLTVCSPGKWDMDCKQQCDVNCPDFCNEWDGSCPTACLGYQAPSCTAECPLDKWGVNCREDCRDRCQYKYCNSVDGLCTAGCNGYSDPPYCTKVCMKGFYGTNCGSKCSSNCNEGICDHKNGTCSLGCQDKQGPFCGVSSDLGQSEFNGSSFGIGLGVGAVIVILVVVIVVVVFKYIRHRKKRGSREQENVNTESSQTNIAQSARRVHATTIQTVRPPQNYYAKDQDSDDYEIPVFNNPKEIGI